MDDPYRPSDLSIVAIGDTDQAADWAKVQQTCPFLTDWGVNTLREGLDGYVKAVLIEPHYICRDYRNLYSHFYSKKFVPRESYCGRLHFFSKAEMGIDDIFVDTKGCKKEYIGYSIIQPIAERCIGRTMIDPSKVTKPDGAMYCLSTRSSVHIGGVSLSVRAYPYSSQTGEPTVCAHAALWGVCRYLSERYSTYGEVHPYDLIEMTGYDSGRRVPYRGMTYRDYSTILSNFGCHPVIIKPRTHQKKWSQDKLAFHDIYALIESGFPVLVSYNGHAATIVGHTLQDTIVSGHEKDSMVVSGKEVETKFYNSFSMVKQFRIVDDNFFPYQLLGYPTDPKNYGNRLKNILKPTPSIDSIYAAVIPLPEKAFLPPDKARQLGYEYLSESLAEQLLGETMNELGRSSEEPLIARLFLTSSIAFKARKRQCATGELGESMDSLAMLPVSLSLPHFIWVMEISPLCDYNDRYCIAEVVLDASISEDEAENVYMRVGKRIIKGDDVADFNAGALRFPQYTHNLGEGSG